MNTFYAPYFSDQDEYLPEDEAKHAVQVLRMAEGDEFLLVDGAGKRALARLTEVKKKSARYEILSQERLPQLQPRIHLAVGPPKSLDRLSFLVEKCTELGVASIQFLVTARSERREVNVERMERVAVAAMKQSGQAWLPQFPEPDRLANVIKLTPAKTKLIAHLEDGERKTIWSLGTIEEALILIGPEGDFTPEEIELCLKAKFHPVTLGQTVLRTETACVAALVQLLS